MVVVDVVDELRPNRKGGLVVVVDGGGLVVVVVELGADSGTVVEVVGAVATGNGGGV